MVKTIIFDMDGTMFDTEPLWEKAFIKTGEELGYPLTKELHDKTISSNQARLAKILTKELDDSFPIDEFLKKYTENMKNLIEEGLPIKKGLIELLDYLKTNDYTISIASSSDLNRIKRNLEITNIDENIFDVIVSGENFNKGKPDPDIYLKTIELLNIDPKEIIAIEDSNSGIKAAHLAGCIPILIPDVDIIDEETEKLAKYKFDSLLGVIDLLQNKK